MPAGPDLRSTASSEDRTDSVFARAARGERGALGALLTRCLPAIRRWAHGRLSQAAHAGVDTADMVHDAVAQTLPRLGSGQLHSERALTAYLRQAVTNRIHDEHRRLIRRGPHEAGIPDIASEKPSPLEETLAREDEARYRASLARLRPGDRELIVAHVELGYSIEQLGAVSGRSPNAARVALQRAVRRLVASMQSD